MIVFEGAVTNGETAEMAACAFGDPPCWLCQETAAGATARCGDEPEGRP